MQTFITASQDLEKHPKKQPGQPSDTKLQSIKQQISSIISKMPNQQACQQAAINIGLPLSILQFDKIIKFTSSQNNINSLHYTFNQLKVLHKEASKLKNKFHQADPEGKQKYKPNYIIKQRMKKQKKQGMTEQSVLQEKRNMFQRQKLKRACEEQLYARAKNIKFMSIDCLERKKDLLNKKAETAKSMNQKAFKIFKNQKQKHQKYFQAFKIKVIFQPNTKKQQTSTTLNSKDSYFKTTIKSSNNRETFYQPSPSQKPLPKNNWFAMDHKGKNGVKSTTAVVKMRSKYRNTEESSSAHQHFDKVKQKYIETILKRQSLQKIQQEHAIQRYIKKQQKILELRLKQQKGSQSPSNNNLKTTQNIVVSSLATNQKGFEIDHPTIVCQQKQMKKDSHLQQKVNRLREQSKTKQQRLKRHRLRQQKQNQQLSKERYIKMIQNMLRSRQLKEQCEAKRQMVIRKRYEQVNVSKKNDNFIFNLHRYRDNQLKKFVQEIKREERRDGLEV